MRTVSQIQAESSNGRNGMVIINANENTAEAVELLNRYVWDVKIYGHDPVETSKILGYEPEDITKLDATIRGLIASKILTALDEIDADIKKLVK
jgi:hypothetical protein|tara:strand:- start:722 stop:1003 length:282 start_codon:yes stop_codon:yes gene_type:complete